MAKFTVVPYNKSAIKYDGEYEIGARGVLAIKQNNGNPTIFSPSGWLYLEVTDASDD